MIKMRLQLFGGGSYGSGHGHATGGGGTAAASAAAAITPEPTLTVPVREFHDKAKPGSMDYVGDGHEQVEFFNEHSNYNELIESMNEDDHDAFRSWMNGWFMDGQQYKGFDKMSKYDRDYTRSYDKILDQATLDQGVKMARLSDSQLVLGAGKKTATLAELQAMEGQTVKSKGSMSFGVASEGLMIGGYGEKNVEYQLTVPGGSKGAGMWIGDKRIGGWGAGQREFMTNRDSVFKVGKTTHDSKRDIYVVELEWQGHTAHDYGIFGKP